MSSFRHILFAATFLATPVLADCNPPPPGLDYNQWLALCPAEINYAYQVYGNGMDPEYFAQSLYMYYVQAAVQATTGGGMPAPMAPCDAASNGATFCPSSGYLLTCNGQYWLTGASTC